MIHILAARYAWIANHLNADAYRQQMERRRSPLKQFNPCPKALHFTAALNQHPLPPSTVVIFAASTTPCTCHSSYSALDLDLLYNDSIRAIPHNFNPDQATEAAYRKD